MSVVEKAGSPLDALVSAKRKSSQIKVVAPELPSKQFSIDFDRFKEMAYFTPDNMASPIAKELRAVKRRLLRRLGFLRASGERQAFRTPGRQRNLVLVTSSQAGEGKTFCAINLALSLALEDKIETILIDADIPRPKIRARFGIEKGAGLIDCLQSTDRNFRNVMHRAKEAPLSIIGEGRSIERSGDILAGENCQKLFAEIAAANRDGIVIVDAPPALTVTDAVILAKYVDEIVFAVEANRTPESSVASTLDDLLDVNPNVSLVLNRCLIGSGSASYGSYDYYGRDSSAKPSDDGDKDTNK